MVVATIPDEVKSPAFDQDSTRQYQLHILFKKTLALIGIRDPKNRSWVYLKKAELQLPLYEPGAHNPFKRLFTENELLQENYENVNIRMYLPFFEILPSRWSGLKEKSSFFRKLYKDLPELTFDEVRVGEDQSLLYGVPVQIFDLIESRFTAPRIEHSAGTLINHLLEMNRNCKKNKVYAYVNEELLEVVVMNKGKLMLYNAYAFHSREDFIYYIALIYDQLNLDREEAALIFLGEVEKDAAIFHMAYKYVKHIRLGKREESWEIPEPWNDLPGHYYFNLLAC